MLYEGIRVVIRTRRRQDIADAKRTRISSEASRVGDGPTLRLKTLIKTSPCSSTIQAILHENEMTPELESEYLHDMREGWRNFLMQRVARERSHQYAGAERYDRGITMSYHDKLEKLANGECDPEVCDYDEWATEQTSEDIRNSTVDTVSARVRI